MLIYLSRQVEDRFSVPVNMPVDGVMAGVDQWRIGHVRRRQNRHIVVKVAGRDCLLSPKLARQCAASIACAQVNSNNSDIICSKWPPIKIVYCGVSYGFSHIDLCEINRH